MKYRSFGATGFNVSEIGFGCWGLGGGAYGDIDDDTAKRCLRQALDVGVNFFDTSNLYGDGHSEELIGETLAGDRDHVIIATKGGTLPHSGFHMPQDFSAANLREALESSLRRLRVDHVDLYQLHSPELSVIEGSDEAVEALRAFQAEGKIRSYGISARSPHDALTAIKTYDFPVVQVNFNMIDQRALHNGLFELAAKQNTALIIRTPLVFGYLTGAMSGDETFQQGDHRGNWPKDQLKRWADSASLFDFLVKDDRTAVQAALRFCLDFEAVGTVIPGMMSLEHVLENTKASDLPPLSEDERQRIDHIYRTHEFYDKSAKGRGKQK